MDDTVLSLTIHETLVTTHVLGRHQGKGTGEMDQKIEGEARSNYAPKVAGTNPIDRRRTSRLQTPARSHDDLDSRAPRYGKATERKQHDRRKRARRVLRTLRIRLAKRAAKPVTPRPFSL
jgi:hypothetical protein